MATLRPPFKAGNMQGLFKAVVKGMFPRIKGFSDEFQRVVKSMITVRSNKRPTCDNILALSVIKNYDEQVIDESKSVILSQQENLLSTIYVPKDVMLLTKQLPKPKYDICTSRISTSDLQNTPIVKKSSKIHTKSAVKSSC